MFWDGFSKNVVLEYLCCNCQLIFSGNFHWKLRAWDICWKMAAYSHGLKSVLAHVSNSNSGKYCALSIQDAFLKVSTENCCVYHAKTCFFTYLLILLSEEPEHCANKKNDLGNVLWEMLYMFKFGKPFFSKFQLGQLWPNLSLEKFRLFFFLSPSPSSVIKSDLQHGTIIWPKFFWSTLWAMPLSLS